ncbi:MAG: AAA family ATPase [Micropruina sp.]|nr:MAG: AAA family ATPase [Micropruina sp.]
MAVHTWQDYEDVLATLGACVSTRIPVLLWGDPGSGKTSVVESAAKIGYHVETLIISHYEPSDFAGLPMLHDGHVTLAPPSWAKRLTQIKGPAIAFFDEFSTASPALQAAALRPLTHYQVGDLQLPATVSFVAAANPADVAAAGWELAAPTASRFVHLEWGLPLDVYSECLVSGGWPTLPVGPLPEGYETVLDQQRALIAGFLRARSSQLSKIPDDPASRGRAFPTPRTWDYASRLSAYAIATGASEQVIALLVAGCVGELVAHEFLTFAARQDLPDPEDVLSGKFTFAGLRADRTYVVLQSVLAAVQRTPDAKRWTAAVEVCAEAAATAGVDPAVPVVRALLRPGARPAGAALPPTIRVFAPVLALSGLLPSA